MHTTGVQAINFIAKDNDGLGSLRRLGRKCIAVELNRTPREENKQLRSEASSPIRDVYAYRCVIPVQTDHVQTNMCVG